MGRRVLPVFILAMNAVSATSITGVDVLARAQNLILATPATAPTTIPSLITLTANDVPSDVATSLSARSIAWTSLTDVMRIGVLWAHGYAVPGGGSNSLVKVHTACSSDWRDDVAGRYMDDIGLPGVEFNVVGCENNTCGTFFQATNGKCTDNLSAQLLCAVNATNLPTSNDSFWSDAGNDSTSVPFPQLYTHTLSVTSAANKTKNVKIVSIHMASTAGTPTCGSTGDAIVPCVALADVTSGQQFCRPKVDTERLKVFFDVVSKHLTSAATSMKSSSDGKSDGLSTGVIIGIVAGAVVVLGLLAFYFFRTKKKKTDPDFVMGERKSSNGRGNNGNNAPPGFIGMGPKAINRQGTFPLIDSSRDNETVFSSDYVEGGNNLDEDSRQSRFSRRLLQSQQSVEGLSTRSRNSSISRTGMYGKTVDEYCEESDMIREFINDPQIKIRRIPYEELTVLRILSKGSYGEVFLGQLETRHVAMKRLLPEKKHLTKSIEQFMGEIQIMCNLEHRNIVTFVGVSWDYLQNISVVVEYMDNGDLAEVLAKSKNKLTWKKEKISISMDIAEGLVYLHSMRPVIVHRDLKSKNVLLNKRGQAKLSDFGVSRKTTVNETMTSGVGTLLWTAPEIIEGRKYSEKADIFSLGVVLSEIDTCEEPYSTVKNEDTGERLPGMQIVQMVRLGELRVNFRDDCPPKLRELAQQCTDLDPDKRPTSMEVAYTLKSIIAPSLRTADSA